MNMIRKMVLVISWSALLLTIACDSPGVETPEVSFSVSPSPYYALDTLSFQNESVDGDTYLWLFGDGEYSNEIEPRHAYSTEGDYLITLRVENSEKRAEESMMLTVVPPFDMWETHVIDNELDYAVSIDVCDFDLDGDLDIVDASFGNNQVVIYYNNHPIWDKSIIDHGSFGTTFAYCADVNSDGRVDIVGNAYSVRDFNLYINTESGWVKETIISSTPSFDYFSMYDLNQDGKADIVAGGDRIRRGPLSWYENQYPNWIYHEIDGSSTSYPGFGFGDIDQDGLIDIASAQEFNDLLVWYKNNGNNDDWTQNIIATGIDQAWFAETGDYDDDGDIDVTLAVGGPYTNGKEIILFENQNLNWIRHDIDNNLRGAVAAQIVDLDHDGYKDIIASGTRAGDIVWYKRNNNSWIKHVIHKTEQPRLFKIADVTGDGVNDYIITGWSEVFIFEQNEKYPDEVKRNTNKSSFFNFKQ